jgi:hypothetical protein
VFVQAFEKTLLAQSKTNSNNNDVSGDSSSATPEKFPHDRTSSSSSSRVKASPQSTEERQEELRGERDKIRNKLKQGLSGLLHEHKRSADQIVDSVMNLIGEELVQNRSALSTLAKKLQVRVFPFLLCSSSLSPSSSSPFVFCAALL